MRIAAFYENIWDACRMAGEGLEEMLVELKGHGLEMIYISGTALAEKEEELTALFERLRLPVEGMHQHFDLGHHPEDRSWKGYMDLAKRVGAGNFLCVPGMIPKADEGRREEMMGHMTAAVRDMVEYGKKIGLTVCMEDYDSMESPFNGIDGLARFMEEAPGLMCAFDTGNFVCHGEDPMEAFERFKDKIVTVHVKDRQDVPWTEGDGGCLCGDGSVAYVAPVGYGRMPIEKVIGRLKEQGYMGNLIAELFSCGDLRANLIRSLEWLRERV